jgi:hypothetical protein
MATTTNYGWTTPDDTALVKDGASAIRTLGSSVDTTTKNLNPETTLGDLSFRSSTSNVNTRIPIGSSGQHLTVVAGVPAWATASDQTPLTTKGDLLGFSTLDARIPIGANDTVLTADSTQSLGLKWAAAGGTVFPAFSAYLASDQTPTVNVWTKVNINTEAFDTNSNFDTTTYRFTPTVAGYYVINANAYVYQTTAGNQLMAIYKNGSQFKTGATYNSSTGAHQCISAIINFNGSSDYVELYARGTAGTVTFSNGQSDTYLDGVGVKS